jgi:hypothetical protein
MAKRITEKVLVQRLLQIINEGKRETTYKFSLLLALIDWCTSNGTIGGIRRRRLFQSPPNSSLEQSTTDSEPSLPAEASGPGFWVACS